MHVYVSNISSRVVYYIEADTTFLQSLEGTLLQKIWVSGLPAGMTRENSAQFSYNGSFVRAVDVSPADSLLARKCAALHTVNNLVQRVRYPYTKSAYMQEYVYDRKYHDAVGFIASDRTNTAPFPYLQDEVAIAKKNPVLVAREIIRARIDREDILRNSERARRAFTKMIGEATTLQRLDEITRMLTVRNFKLPFEV